VEPDNLEELTTKEGELPAASVFRSSRTRRQNVAGGHQFNPAVAASPAPGNISNQSPHESKLVQTVNPSRPRHSPRKGTKLPKTGVAKKTAINPVSASQSRPGSKKRKDTSNTRRPVLGPQVPVLLVSAEAPAPTTEAQITQTQESSAAAPTPSDMPLLQMTDPEQIASRKELLDVLDGHKLIHMLRHATAWSKYILVIAYI